MRRWAVLRRSMYVLFDNEQQCDDPHGHFACLSFSSTVWFHSQACSLLGSVHVWLQFVLKALP